MGIHVRQQYYGNSGRVVDRAEATVPSEGCSSLSHASTFTRLEAFPLSSVRIVEKELDETVTTLSVDVRIEYLYLSI